MLQWEYLFSIFWDLLHYLFILFIFPMIQKTMLQWKYLFTILYFGIFYINYLFYLSFAMIYL